MEGTFGFKKRVGMIVYVAVFLMVELIFGFFMLESRHIFVENSIQHGGYLAQAQVEKIETRMEQFTLSLELAGKYLDEMVDLQVPDTEIHRWMSTYCKRISEGFGGDNVLDLYAVLSGRIVAANPWEGDDEYDFSSKLWYSEAVAAAPGTIAFSDLYTDAVTGQNVFTVSLALSHTGDVAAMDVYLVSDNWMGLSQLPEGYALEVFDPRQTPAYSIGNMDLGAFQKDILDNATNELTHYAGSIQAGRNFYVCKLSNGWSVVVAIPGDKLLSREHMFLINLGLGLNVVNMVITTAFLIRYLRNRRNLRQDILTGVLNRSYLIKQIGKQLKKSGGTLLLVDLDNFKQVNDNYGHDHGDLVLVQVAEALQNCFRKAGCIGRFGGDEFIIYADAALTDEALDRKVQEIIRQVTMISRKYPLSDLTVSIGGCRCKKGDKYADVFKRADEALYEVKRGGKCGFLIN